MEFCYQDRAVGVWQSLVVIPILGEDESHLYVESSPTGIETHSSGYLRKGSNQDKSKRLEVHHSGAIDPSSRRRWSKQNSPEGSQNTSMAILKPQHTNHVKRALTKGRELQNSRNSVQICVSELNDT